MTLKQLDEGALYIGSSFLSTLEKTVVDERNGLMPSTRNDGKWVNGMLEYWNIGTVGIKIGKNRVMEK